METLLELLPRIRSFGSREAIRFSNGIRTWNWSYQDLGDGITRFAAYLDQQGFAPGDRLLLWSENRPEWIAVFWACLSRGVVVVPLDAHSTPRRVAGIRAEAGTRLLVRGSSPSDFRPEDPVFRIEDLGELPLPVDHGEGAVDADGIVEILYTSGTTADPKGVIHRHRNICSNLTPIDREIDRYRHWAPSLPAGPTSRHGSVEPHVRSVDGCIHPRASRGFCCLSVRPSSLGHPSDDPNRTGLGACHRSACPGDPGNGHPEATSGNRICPAGG